MIQPAGRAASEGRRLDGRAAAAAIRAEVAAGVAAMAARSEPPPCLAAVLVGDDPASAVYVRNKLKACGETGLLSREHRLGAGAGRQELLGLLRSLNDDDAVDGILVQMPLPAGLDRREVIEAIDPAKDVDGFHPVNVGRLWSGGEGFVPCTPLGIVQLLDRSGVPLEGAEAVVLGRSEIVGKPMAALLLARHATVTVCHSRTPSLARIASRADLLVAAIGRPAFVTREFIKPGATVIDVGINQVGDEARARELFPHEPERAEQVRRRGYTLVGDVHPAHAAQRAGAWTPVPGGVGPLTVALLLSNTLKAARLRRASRRPQAEIP
ncbi:MAG TPA: bifunctional 5,10-methylenetetrahydrofolate dehydrogenase/5,10-methenyltetrahydrofolate cyclohydrolase [Candidatus Polarisedimenticolia bacterium]|nr:bifunctional 5,10-methylenetetrahydrofolate dehydrogenase/5,10-methenyltetrahydrofolate cyclohydrolase [Candidatus Polarisedimenticolia bacterium]